MLALHRCVQSLCMLQKYLNKVWSRLKNGGGTWLPDHLVWFLLLCWAGLFLLKHHKFQCICKFFCIFFLLHTRPMILIRLIRSKTNTWRGLCWLQTYLSLQNIVLAIIKTCITSPFFFLRCSGLNLHNKNIQHMQYAKYAIMKIWLRDLLWTVCLGRWSFLLQIMHTQRYLPSSPTVSLQSLSHLTQNMHVSFECQVSYVSKTNSSAQPTHSNQHISTKSHLYAVLCPLMGMGKKEI